MFFQREIELLELFNENEGKVVSRDLILDKLWEKTISNFSND